MLEPEGMSPMETLLLRKGEGLDVGLGGKEGFSGLSSLLGSLCPPALVPRSPSSPVPLHGPACWSWSPCRLCVQLAQSQSASGLCPGSALPAKPWLCRALGEMFWGRSVLGKGLG